MPEFSIERKGAAAIRVDGAVLDDFHLTRGLWEAKDSHDDLEKEIKAKLAIGYPKQNIIFLAPERAALRRGNSEGLAYFDPKGHVGLNLFEPAVVFFNDRLQCGEEVLSSLS